jgi:hypothetical protein
METKRNRYRNSVRNTEGKRYIGSARNWWENKIEIALREMGLSITD